MRTEVYRGGQLVAATIVDLERNTITQEKDGLIVSERSLTDDERAMYEGPVDPRAALLERVADAKTVAALRTVLTDALTQGML